MRVSKGIIAITVGIALARLSFSADPLQDLAPIHSREVQIEQNQIRPQYFREGSRAKQILNGLFPCFRDVKIDRHFPEGHGVSREFRVLLIVFDQEDFERSVVH